MRRWQATTAVLALGAVCFGPVAAQEGDQGYLAAFLQDSLSDAGRQVTITGFAGALSSRATIDTLTIADDTGIWLTITGVRLDWSRSSLLSGALEIDELSAESITLTRLPDTPESTAPAPEASGFSLPELPVTVNIGRIAADRIDLAESVLGQPVEGSLSAALQLNAGVGRAVLDLTRTGDGPEGVITLDAGYDNASGQLDLLLDAREGAGGIVASLLGVPGTPAARIRLAGRGPVTDFTADLSLATDGEDRLAGKITLSGADGADFRLQADVSGNIAPLLVPDHVDFFGPEVSLVLDARRSPLGRLTLDKAALRAQAVTLEGSGVLAADGMPETLSLTGSIAAPDGSPVLLPFGATETRIDRADFQLSLRGEDGWAGSVSLASLVRADLRADLVNLSGSGRIGRTAAGASFGGTLRLLAEGILPSDTAVATALGSRLEGGLKLHLLAGSDALRLSDMNLAGEGYAAKGALRIEGLETALLTTGRLAVSADDLSRFSALAGADLGGKGSITLTGSASGLSGFLDAVVDVAAQDLTMGEPMVDRLLAGESTASLSVLRDETGTTLRGFDLAAGALVASGSGKIASSGAELSGSLRFANLLALDPRFTGSASLEASFSGTSAQGKLTVDGSAQGVRIGYPSVDPLLAGVSTLSAGLTLDDGALRVDSAMLSNPQLDLTLTGEGIGPLHRLAIAARLGNLGLLMPGLQGPLSVTGSAAPDGDAYRVDLSAKGPGQVDGRILGTVAGDFATADLAISGTGRSELANLFIAPRNIEGPVSYDLRLAGPVQLSSLSGRVTLANGRLSDPGLGFALEGIEGLAVLQSGQAQVSATAGLSSGGRVRLDGPVALSAPYAGQLDLALDQTRLFDPDLYDARLTGRLSISGPLTGGALIAGSVLLSETQLRVPESGFDAFGSLPGITHLNEPAEVRATRVRAGLLAGAADRSGGGAAPFRLDLTVSAPSRIFLRGRGIDAELGGQIRLLGTTAAIQPSGAFTLIRGRLDILGKRLNLSRADLVLEGSFVPTVQITAETESDGIVSTISIAGPADNPVVSFTSVPSLPQEEVLARLLFGRGLQNISPLQAAQLASAVAVLAGRSGVGLIDRLRQGFGLDDLDLATGEDGSTTLTAGKYISENLYSEIEIDHDGKSQINLNLDLRPGVTVKGRLSGDGNTGIGLFIEKDY